MDRWGADQHVLAKSFWCNGKNDPLTCKGNIQFGKT